MDELIRRAMEEDSEETDTDGSQDQAAEQTQPDEGSKNPADEDIFILDGEDGSEDTDGQDEKDQLRSMIEQGEAEDDAGSGSTGIQELADEHDQEQSIPRSSNLEDAEGRRRERQPHDQRAEARSRSEAKSEPVEEAEAVSRDQTQDLGATAEARDVGGTGPQQQDEGSSDGSGGQQASSSDASAERLEALSDPNDTPDDDSPSDRYRQLKEEARQEFLEQERADNEATVEKATDSLKEKYDRLGDEYVVN